jgi:hypothetical protein
MIQQHDFAFLFTLSFIDYLKARVPSVAIPALRSLHSQLVTSSRLLSEEQLADAFRYSLLTDPVASINQPLAELLLDILRRQTCSAGDASTIWTMCEASAARGNMSDTWPHLQRADLLDIFTHQVFVAPHAPEHRRHLVRILLIAGGASTLETVDHLTEFAMRASDICSRSESARRSLEEDLHHLLLIIPEAPIIALGVIRWATERLSHAEFQNSLALSAQACPPQLFLFDECALRFPGLHTEILIACKRLATPAFTLNVEQQIQYAHHITDRITAVYAYGSPEPALKSLAALSARGQLPIDVVVQTLQELLGFAEPPIHRTLSEAWERALGDTHFLRLAESTGSLKTFAGAHTHTHTHTHTYIHTYIHTHTHVCLTVSCVPHER